MDLSYIVNLVGIDKSWVIEIIKYLIISIPLFLWIFYLTTIQELKKYLSSTNTKDAGILKLIQKELLEDNNIALSIFLWSKLVALSIIISSAMVFNLLWVIIFTFIWYLIQVISVMLFEKTIWIDNLFSHTIEKQSIAISVLYGFLVIALSMLIWTTLI